MKIECQECGAEINIPEDAVVGEIITCAECGADFEISSKSNEKVEVKTAETMAEDWGQ
jgi:alpha-aminoadipate/glutamate carrier protein LysW